MAREQLLNLIKEEQARSGYVTESGMKAIAQSLGIPLGEVFGTATFYSFLDTKPRGRHVIRVCKSVPCYLQNGEKIASFIEKELKIAPGEITADGQFSFELTNCIGACDQAPAMLIDDDLYGDLNPEKIKAILQSYE